MDNGFTRHKGAYLAEGVLFLILGILAITLPNFFSFAVELLIGWLFLFSGIFQGFRAFSTRHIPGFWVSLISAIFYIVAGALLLLFPLKGILTLTFILSLFFFLEGIAQITFALTLRPARNWGWLVLNGALALAIAFIIWSGWPKDVTWVLGLLVGINLLFYGLSRIFLASSQEG